MIQHSIEAGTCISRALIHGGRSWRFVVPLALLAGCAPEAPPPAAAPPAEVSVSRPLSRTVADSIEYTGSTAPLEQVEVRARVTGFLNQVHFSPRQKVEPGALLFTIDKRPFETAVASAKAGLDSVLAQLEKAQHDTTRLDDLFKQAAASDEEVRDARSKRDVLAAAKEDFQARLEKANLELSWCEVRAPIGGRLSRSLYDVGNIVSADTTVLTGIVNDEQMYVYFNASERDILKLREKTRRDRAAAGETVTSQPEFRDVHMKAFVGLMTEVGFPHEGVLDYAAPSVDKVTGTQQVRAILPNSDGVLLAGLFVRVRIPIGAEYQALAVTERALGTDQGQRFLYVVNDKNVVEYRPVTIGSLQDGLRVISAGLAPTDRVVVVGIQRVRPGLTVKPVDAPMPVQPGAASPGDANATTAPANVTTATSGH